MRNPILERERYMYVNKGKEWENFGVQTQRIFLLVLRYLTAILNSSPLGKSDNRQTAGIFFFKIVLFKKKIVLFKKKKKASFILSTKKKKIIN